MVSYMNPCPRWRTPSLTVPPVVPFAGFVGTPFTDIGASCTSGPSRVIHTSSPVPPVSLTLNL